MRSNRSMPSATVIPVLSASDVESAARWLCNAFGFSVRVRIGSHRIQLAAGDGAIIIHEGLRAKSGDAVMVRVTGIDDHARRAREAGAEIVADPKDYPYGERQYTARDRDGRVWTFSETVADVHPSEWGGSVEHT